MLAHFVRVLIATLYFMKNILIIVLFILLCYQFLVEYVNGKTLPVQLLCLQLRVDDTYEYAKHLAEDLKLNLEEKERKDIADGVKGAALWDVKTQKKILLSEYKCSFVRNDKVIVSRPSLTM